MKGERQQDGLWGNEERSLKYTIGDRAAGVELSQSSSVASAAAEFIITGGQYWEATGQMKRTYVNHAAAEPAFLVLREGREDGPTPRAESGFPAGPCLVRSEEWLRTPELATLMESWLASEDERQAERVLQRIYYRLRAEAAALLESPEGDWAVVTLLFTPELAAQPARLAALQDAQLEALFTELTESLRRGGDSRLDLVAPYPASAAEFADSREFIEEVAEQTLGHAYAATCRIGALIAPDVQHATAGEIARIADFLVLDGAAGEPAPEDTAAEGFAQAAGDILAAVRRVKPAAILLAAGAPAAVALADLYLLGLNGIFCSAAQRTEALLRAACLIWIARQDGVDSGASSRQ
ncbi:hypothetical protein H1230_05200 [Paenibacillus sp. 19GGS1-52]|uniref:hypothetical protein n=1 Tax=Paenibacillus sp. 19GGS1-52 TaxID=2758563 RepID=UPI001EFB187C|nr:hypothetical protein [Paenibacillus sp. 19GGS1-52]ULO08230.1 hypothetical protein H1230_05200 [Paenibacillus sp. 19GGS1-52]